MCHSSIQPPGFTPESSAYGRVPGYNSLAGKSICSTICVSQFRRDISIPSPYLPCEARLVESPGARTNLHGVAIHGKATADSPVPTADEATHHDSSSRTQHSLNPIGCGLIVSRSNRGPSRRPVRSARCTADIPFFFPSGMDSPRWRVPRHTSARKKKLTILAQVRKVAIRPHPRTAESQGQREGICTEELEGMPCRDSQSGYGFVRPKIVC